MTTPPVDRFVNKRIDDNVNRNISTENRSFEKEPKKNYSNSIVYLFSIFVAVHGWLMLQQRLPIALPEFGGSQIVIMRKKRESIDVGTD